MSAMGSVIMAVQILFLPAGLAQAGDKPVAGEVAEADAADAELAEDRPGPAAQFAAEPDANPLARLHQLLGVVLAVALRLFQLLKLAFEADALGGNRHIGLLHQ